MEDKLQFANDFLAWLEEIKVIKVIKGNEDEEAWSTSALNIQSMVFAIESTMDDSDPSKHIDMIKGMADAFDKIVDDAIENGFEPYKVNDTYAFKIWLYENVVKKYCDPSVWKDMMDYLIPASLHQAILRWEHDDRRPYPYGDKIKLMEFIRNGTLVPIATFSLE